MKLHYKYFSLLLLCCFLGNDLIYAQQKNSAQGEIVMKQSELDSLLLKIVRHKKEQMAKQRADRNVAGSRSIDPTLQPERTTMSASMGQPQQDVGSYNEERIYNEFARLNNRLDGLILNMGGSGAGVSSVPPRQTFSTPGGGEPNVIYMQPGSQNQQPTLAPGFGMNATQTTPKEGKSDKVIISSGDGDKQSDEQAKLNMENAKLQNEISQLTEKVRVLGKLEEVTESDEYSAEISELNGKIAELRSNLDQSNKAAASERESRAKSQHELDALKDLREYSMKVYFANNSTTLGSSDKMALVDLADIIKNHEKNLTVMLHGFASKSGSASYNNKISFERAEAVKNALRGLGIRARNIVSLPHGVDDSGDADQARRVEISLVVM